MAKNDTATKDGHLNAPIAITYAKTKQDQVRLEKEAAKRKSKNSRGSNIITNNSSYSGKLHLHSSLAQDL